MIVRELKPKVYSLSAIDWDRKLFDELVALPEGTSYNAYLVVGSEKTALIDTVHPSMTAALIDALRSLGLARLDYIVANHAEPDHSGSIPALLAEFPEARVLANVKCRSLLKSALDLPAEALTLIQDEQVISLGDKSLRFMWVPWVHWPDTTITYLVEDRIAFTCDFLGAHLATSDLYASDEARVERAALTYYAEIMMPYRPNVNKHLKRLSAIDLEMIAPSHGPVHARPDFILSLYRRWAGDETRPQVVIPYLSMYESTATMVAYLIDRLMEKGIAVQPFQRRRPRLRALRLGAGRSIDARLRLADRARRPAPGDGLRRLPGQRLAPEDPIRGDHRLVRLGSGDARKPERAAAQPQGRLAEGGQRRRNAQAQRFRRARPARRRDQRSESGSGERQRRVLKPSSTRCGLGDGSGPVRDSLVFRVIVSNLRRAKRIKNSGSRKDPIWVLAE